MNWAPIARIALRYGSGALVSYGLISDDAGHMLATDPDILALAGLVIGALTEGLYALAVKKGWAR